MQIIHLDDSDDIISICDRLTWAETQQALLVLPEGGGVLREGLDLVRLRRFADRQRLELGLVTPDVPITRQARAIGLPVFPSVDVAETSRRGWWRGRKRRERVGLPTVGDGGWEEMLETPTSLVQRPYPPLDPADRQEMNRRLSPKSTLRLWLVRYAAIFLFCLTLAILYAAFTYAVPSATIILQPETETVQVERPVIADPAVEAVDYALNTVPARLLTTTESWQTSVATTGVVALPDASARGMVLFVNQLAQAVTIPAGTRVSTSDGSNVAFQTLEDVTLGEAVGSTAEVEVIAEVPGPQGNVVANLVNRVQGALDLQVEVRNLEPMSGGAVRETAAVSLEDKERLRAQALQFLEAVALANMEAQLTEREFLSKDAVRVVNILDETFSHDVGEQTAELTLVMRAELVGTAVDTTVASGLAFDSLGQVVPAGFTLVPDSIRFSSGEVVAVDEAGRVTFSMIGEGVVAANLALDDPITAVTGQSPEMAAAYLYQNLPLRAVPTLDIWPLWFDRVPYLTERIQTEIEP
ncbi:baseplate J/gp47 family protein [Candidatus Leptofilum sp.]|uniref:baseplate J/gp47 family protein n=1 Tax=Candidatus Leptofilum sp. TaxID=3241576 RepID=UPI003B5A735C